MVTCAYDEAMSEACGHCGFKGPMEHKEEQIALKRGTGEVTPDGEEFEWGEFLSVAQCPACDQPNIWTYSWIDLVGEPQNERRIYPTERDNSVLPEKVRKQFDAALKVKKIEPGLYAVGIRRMLETVANEEQAAGKDLFEKLDDLAADGRIPGPLAKIAHQLRELGNLGAHDAEIEVEPEDVPVIGDLADAILEYLYRAPAKLATVQAGIEERRFRAAGPQGELGSDDPDSANEISSGS
jgi:hypothetical protein